MASPQAQVSVVDDSEILHTGIALCGVLLELLDEELQLMLARDSDGLDTSMRKKQQVLDDLQAIEGRLAECLQRVAGAPPDSDLHVLHRRMRECRDNNRRNQMAAMTGMRVSRHSLQMLRGMLHLDDLSLYGADGELKTKREKRKLGRL